MAPTLLKNLTLEKWVQIVDVAGILNVPAYHLAAVICFETAGSFSPLAENPLSGAIGLIQFTSIGVRSIKSFNGLQWAQVRSRLVKMNFEEQLNNPVKEYLEANKGANQPLLSDLYMSIIAPVAVGTHYETVLYKSPTKAYTQNKGLDFGNKGYITKADASSEVYRRLTQVLLRIKQLDGGV